MVLTERGVPLFDVGGTGSGSEPTGILVGLVEAGDSFPTTRPDGSALQNEDYVKPSVTATFPFTISGIQFNNARDKAFYLSGSWHLDPGAIQDTDETPLSNPAQEKFESERTNQYQLNLDVIYQLKNAIIEYADLDTVPSTKLYKRIYKQTAATSARPAGLYYYNFNSTAADKWEKLGGGIDSGSTLPSGLYAGQLFVLTNDIEQSAGTVLKGLYRYNGSAWNLEATAFDFIELTADSGTLSTADYDTIRLRQDALIIDKNGMVYRFAEEQTDRFIYGGFDKIISVIKSTRAYNVEELAFIFAVPTTEITFRSSTYTIPDISDDFEDIADAVSKNKRVLIYSDNSYFTVQGVYDTDGIIVIEYRGIGELLYLSDGSISFVPFSAEPQCIYLTNPSGTLTDEQKTILSESYDNYILHNNNKLVFQYETSLNLYYGNDNYRVEIVSLSGVYTIDSVLFDIGDEPYSYKNHILPAISVDDLVKVYGVISGGGHQILKWSVSGNLKYLDVLGASYISGKYTIDVLVDSRYRCSYKWDSTTTGYVNPEVYTEKVVVEYQEEFGDYTNEEKALIANGECEILYSYEEDPRTQNVYLHSENELFESHGTGKRIYRTYTGEVGTSSNEKKVYSYYIGVIIEDGMYDVLYDDLKVYNSSIIENAEEHKFLRGNGVDNAPVWGDIVQNDGSPLPNSGNDIVSAQRIRTELGNKADLYHANTDQRNGVGSELLYGHARVVDDSDKLFPMITSESVVGDGTHDIISIARNGKKIVVCMDGDRLQYSDDGGLHWVRPAAARWDTFFTQVISCPREGIPGFGISCESPWSKKWFYDVNDVAYIVSGNPTGGYMAWGDGVHVASSGTDSNIYKSTSITGTMSVAFTCESAKSKIKYVNGKWFFFGGTDATKAGYSDDLTTYVSMTIPAELVDITYYNGYYYGLTPSKIYRSQSLSTWNSVYNINAGLQKFAQTDFCLVALGGSRFACLIGGGSWVDRTYREGASDSDVIDVVSGIETIIVGTNGYISRLALPTMEGVTYSAEEIDRRLSGIRPKYVEIYGGSGTFTESTYATLAEDDNNYIITSSKILLRYVGDSAGGTERLYSSALELNTMETLYVVTVNKTTRAWSIQAYRLQTYDDNTLQTTAKNVPGAINELNEGKTDYYPTHLTFQTRSNVAALLTDDNGIMNFRSISFRITESPDGSTSNFALTLYKSDSTTQTIIATSIGENKRYITYNNGDDAWSDWVEFVTKPYVDENLAKKTNYYPTALNSQTRDNIAALLTASRGVLLVGDTGFTNAEAPGGVFSTRYALALYKYTDTIQTIIATDISSPAKYITTRTVSGWTGWKKFSTMDDLLNKVDYISGQTGLTRAGIFGTLTENNLEMLTGTFASSDLPPDFTTSNRCYILAFKNNSTYGSIIAGRSSGNGEIYKSDNMNGTWGDWVKIATTPEVKSNNVTTIASGTTLDGLFDLVGVKQGEHGVIYSSNFSGVTTKTPPVTNGYMELVFVTTNYKKIILHDSYTTDIYEISKVSGTWGDWTKVATGEFNLFEYEYTNGATSVEKTVRGE